VLSGASGTTASPALHRKVQDINPRNLKNVKAFYLQHNTNSNYKVKEKSVHHDQILLSPAREKNIIYLEGQIYRPLLKIHRSPETVCFEDSTINIFKFAHISR
jgi:hypothetical protein